MAVSGSNEVSARLSKRLANFKLSDAVVKRLSEKVTIDGLRIGRINPCIYGICIDYYSDKLPRLDALTPKSGISRWEVFPYGIIDWDRFLVRVAFEVDELEGRGLTRGFGH
jgi:hypothetical protein